jgi:Methyltransferase domain
VASTPPEYDDELLRLHLEEAAAALPGPDYYTVLRWIHQLVQPTTYVEIGVRQGESLRAALPDTRCVAVDPTPALTGALPSDTRVFPMTSDSFFDTHNLAEIIDSPHFSLAFIDGLHLFEQALRDFIHLERFADRKSIILLHDCLPLDRVTSERTRTTHFYSGDVWKLTMCLKTHGQTLRMATIRTGPTGLCLVSNFDPNHPGLPERYDAYLTEFLPLGFDDYRKHPERMPDMYANSFEAVRDCLAYLMTGVSRGGPSP